MDFVDKEDVARFEVGKQPSKVAGFIEHRAGGDLDIFFQFVAYDVRQRGFPESRRAAEQDVTEHIASIARGAHHDLEPFDGFALPGKISKIGRAQADFEVWR